MLPKLQFRFRVAIFGSKALQTVNLLATDRDSREAKVIGSVHLSVRPSVRRLFSPYLLKRMAFELEFLGRNHSSPGIESQGHRSQVKVIG